MKLENQVTSLELSQKLKELGFPQESLFVWERNHRGEFEIITKEDFHLDHLRNNYRTPEDLFCSAYTVAELGEMAPSEIRKEVSYEETTEETFYLEIRKDEQWWKIEYVYYYYEPCDSFNVIDKNLSDALAKMLIYLKENNLLT